jgi:hypothetical protein
LELIPGFIEGGYTDERVGPAIMAQVARHGEFGNPTTIKLPGGKYTAADYLRFAQENHSYAVPGIVDDLTDFLLSEPGSLEYEKMRGTFAARLQGGTN